MSNTKSKRVNPDPSNYYTVIGWKPEVTMVGGREVRLAVIEGKGYDPETGILDHGKVRFIDDPRYFEPIEAATVDMPVFLPIKTTV